MAIWSPGNSKWIISAGTFHCKWQPELLKSLLSSLNVSNKLEPGIELQACWPRGQGMHSEKTGWQPCSSISMLPLLCLWGTQVDSTGPCYSIHLPYLLGKWECSLHIPPRCHFHSDFNAPGADLTADIILTKLENLMEWVCLIQFLTEQWKNPWPAPSSTPLCWLSW